MFLWKAFFGWYDDDSNQIMSNERNLKQEITLQPSHNFFCEEVFDVWTSLYSYELDVVLDVYIIINDDRVL